MRAWNAAAQLKTDGACATTNPTSAHVICILNVPALPWSAGGILKTATARVQIARSPNALALPRIHGASFQSSLNNPAARFRCADGVRRAPC